MQFFFYPHTRDFLQNLFFLEIFTTEQECYSIALSGGSTPKPLYEAMAISTSIPFEKIELFQVDERYVPQNDEASNYFLIQQSLIRQSIRPWKAFHSFDTSLPLSQALGKYEDELKKRYHPFFDLMLLGMGPDGHIASLFPESSVLHEDSQLVAHTTTHEFTVFDRLTLTFSAIFASKTLVVLVRGKEKKRHVQALKNFAEKWIEPIGLTYDSNELPLFDSSLLTSEMEKFPAKVLVYHPNVTVVFCEE